MKIYFCGGCVFVSVHLHLFVAVIFCPTCIVGERASVAVKDEPAFLPGFDFASHFDQVATAGLFRDGQVEARVCAVARRLNVSPQVKVVLSHRQVPRQRSGLQRECFYNFCVYIIAQMYITCSDRLMILSSAADSLWSRQENKR